MKWFISLAVLLLLICGCTNSPTSPSGGGGGSEVIENPWGRTVIVEGEVANLSLTATFNFGIAVLMVSIENTSEFILEPHMVGESNQYYCYLVTIMGSDGNVLSTRPFGLDEFEDNFDDSQLSPGLTYTEYQWIYPWNLPNDPFGGRMKAEVWLSKEDVPDTTYHSWAEIDLAIDWWFDDD